MLPCVTGALAPILGDGHHLCIQSSLSLLAAGGGGTGARGSLAKGLGLTLCTAGELDLLSTLLGLLLLGILGGGLGGRAGCLADGSGLLALRNNLLPGGAHDGTLHLDDLAGALLGDLLGSALLVQAAEEGGPVELARVLLGHRVDGALFVQEAEGLGARAILAINRNWHHHTLESPRTKSLPWPG